VRGSRLVLLEVTAAPRKALAVLARSVSANYKGKDCYRVNRNE
jgi:hypothetical protein